MKSFVFMILYVVNMVFAAEDFSTRAKPIKQCGRMEDKTACNSGVACGWCPSLKCNSNIECNSFSRCNGGLCMPIGNAAYSECSAHQCLPMDGNIDPHNTATEPWTAIKGTLYPTACISQCYHPRFDFEDCQDLMPFCWEDSDCRDTEACLLGFCIPLNRAVDYHTSTERSCVGDDKFEDCHYFEKCVNNKCENWLR